VYASNLKINVAGRGAERLLTVLPAAIPGIIISGVTRGEDGGLCLTLRNVKNFRSVRKICDKAGFQCELLREFGAGAHLKKLRGRYALWLAPAILIVVLYYASCFVWQIDVSGNTSVSVGDILGALESEGFEAGTYYPGLDTAVLSSKILAKFPKLSFFAVNLHGSRAEVIVREYTPAPKMTDETTPCDIIALTSGTVTKLRVFGGSPAVAVGDTVIQGQTLIYGQGIHALGEIYAEVIREKTLAMPLEYHSKNYSGGTSARSYIKFGNLRLNLYFGTGNYSADCDIIVKEDRLKLLSFELPIVIGQIRASEYKRQTQTLTAAKCIETLQAKFEAEVSNIPEAVDILETTYKATRKGNMILLTQTMKTSQQIGADA
jgi:similar to stage IV sporulation protein